MSGFSNPIIGGGGGLVYPSIHSPDFVHLVSGWSIDKNGNAEFQSLIIPPGSGGATVYVQAIAPATANIGDLWYASANGYSLHQWNGAAWVNYLYGTGALGNGSVTAAKIAANTITAAQIAAGTITATEIAAGTITAAELAAGIIYAGIIDGTTVTGATLEGTVVQGGQIQGGLMQAEGINGGFFAYSSNPGPLNANYTFAAGTSPWTGFDGATVSASALNTFGSSPGSLLFTPDGVTANPGAASEAISVTAGDTYGATAQVTITSNENARLEIRWFNSGGALISTSTGPTMAVTANTQTQLVLPDATAPSGAVTAHLVVQIVGTPAATVLTYVGVAVFGNFGGIVQSVTASSGNDQYGHDIVAGSTTYVEIAPGSFVALNINGADIVWYTATSLAGPWSSGGEIFYTPGATGSLFLENGDSSLLLRDDGFIQLASTGGEILLIPNAGANVGVEGAVVYNSGGTDESWHSLGTLSGATVNKARYRMLPDGQVKIEIDVNFGSSTALPKTFANTLPAAYQVPGSTDIRVPAATTNGDAGARFFAGSVSGGSAGQVQLTNKAGSGVGSYSAYFSYSVI